ncbi:MAG: hypothetical protein H6Q13_695 [Bacteroidetes bacterium]|nr:hypothetical protein [Bacteroidota bacterium]
MNLQIHQMLHGYNQGHNLIQSSIVLSSNEDMDCMATLSDWSEYTNPQDEADYFTIYPLENSEYYVIAKTWYANEMKRPGCVWTHSLLISYNQLSQVADFRIFIDLFVRPQNGDFNFYATPLEIDPMLEKEDSLFANKLVVPSLPLIYDGLINGYPLMYCIENRSQFYQYLCLLLMNYFPYQLLCKLSFSTGSSGLRTLNAKPFSLQFINIQHDSAKSIISCDELELEAVPSCISLAAREIASEKLQFSRLIHTFADEIAADFQNLNGFLILIELINRNYDTPEEKQEGLKLIIAELVTLFPNRESGELLKERFLQKRMTNIFVSDCEFIYCMCISEFINSFSSQSIDFWQRFENIAQSDDRQSYYQLLQKLCLTSHLNEWGKNILARSNDYIMLSDLNTIADENWSLFQSLVSVCPELLNQCSWISYSSNQVEDIISIILTSHASNIFNKWKELLLKIFEKQINVNADLSNLIFQKDGNAVNYVLDYLNTSQKYILPKSIERLSQQESLKILIWMDTVNVLTPSVGLFIMKSIRPISQQVQSRGVERWIAFSKLSKESMSIEYYAYLYLLSFNWSSDSYAIQFMRIAFYPLHEAASESRLGYELWRNISPYTEELPIWHDWDRCKKLRKTVIKRIKKSDFSKDFIKNFTPDKELNRELIKIWDK